MKMFESKRNGMSFFSKGGAIAVAVLAMAAMLDAQSVSQTDLAQKAARLTQDVTRAQAQLEQTQRDLDEMRRQLAELKRAMAANGIAMPSPAPAAAPEEPSAAASQSQSASTAAAIENLRERQAMTESQIATLEESKVESESKYPVKVTGMLLMNGFVNTGAVDTPSDPSVAAGGPGSAGATLRQTVLGIDARGPHLFGASSFADLRADFFGSAAAASSAANYSGYYNANSALLRLRTAHAGLYWNRTQVYFAYDRTILNPDMPTSIAATSVPALAWSGNLWTWNPQAVFSQDFSRRGSPGVELQAALIDVGDAPLTPAVYPGAAAAYVPPTSAEQSSRPGVEARAALIGRGAADQRAQVGIGGYFAEHNTALGHNYDSWASTLDAKLPLPARLEMSGNFYRGAALGGLGAGGYKDFAYSPNSTNGGYYFHPLEDVGGWAQLKERAAERLEFNAAFGMDNVFPHHLRRYYVENGSMIQNLARNRAIAGNVIYSPSAYLLFSFEYRRLDSTPVVDSGATSNIFGIAAGYKF